MADLLPPNATPLERLVASVTTRLSEIPVPVQAVLDPQRCPAELLPWLAWGLSADTWGADWPIYVKRRSLQQSLSIHRRKGTVGALRDAVAAIGVPAEFEEWHQQSPQGAPFTYRVLVNSVATPFLQADLQRLLLAIEANKNLRSHMTELVAGVTSYSLAHSAAVTAQGVQQSIAPRFTDISLLLVGVEEGQLATELAVDGLHNHLHTTLPQQERTAT